MTKRGGKSKVLAPGKLQEQRNRIINKKPIVRKPVHTAVPAKTASAAPTQTTSPTPTQIASSAPKPALPTSSLQAASVAHTSSVQNVVPTPASVHAVTSEFRFMPTPSLIHQTMAGPQSFNPQTTTGVSNSEDDEEEDVDDYEDEDDEVGQENVSPLVPTLDENGKVIIKPSGTGLAPAKEVAGAINYAIRKQFFKPIHHWSELDPLTKAKWFKLFAEKVSWDPCDHAFVYNAFERKGRKRLNDMMGKARKKKTRPPWIGEEAWLGLQDHWNTPEFLVVSSQNKTNRASERGGAVHTSGRKAHIDITLELSHELQRDLRPDELFLKTHKRKNGEWVDKRAASTYTAFKEKFEAELQSTEEGNEDEVQVLDGGRVNQLWTEAAGGRSRGRVYGTADFAVNLKRGSKNFTQQSQTPHHSMFGMPLEAERAARIKAEQMVEAATAQLQEAHKVLLASKEECRAATEAAKAATDAAQRMEREMMALKEFMMKKFDTTTSRSHHHYDDDLDDQSLDEN